MSLQEQVDKDFTLARRKATIGRMWARLRRDQAALQGLVCFEELRRFLGAAGGVYRDLRTVSSGQIVGSAGLCAEFDRDFLPIKAGVGGEMEADRPGLPSGRGAAPGVPLQDRRGVLRFGRRPPRVGVPLPRGAVARGPRDGVPSAALYPVAVGIEASPNHRGTEGA